MKKAEFNRILRAISTDGKLDVDKINVLNPMLRKKIGEFIIRNRGAVVVELAQDMDQSWLAAMGYMYKTTTKRFTFIHPAGHFIEKFKVE